MIGAPMLAARSAYRAGVGLVRVVMPRTVIAAALTLLPEAIGLGLDGEDGEDGDVDKLRKTFDKATALCAGPGLGDEPAANDLLDAILDSGLPTVLDADALNLLAARDAWPGLPGHVVITPHPGEMKRLLKHVPGRDEVPHDDDGRLDLAGAAQQALGGVLVLKGQRTVVRSAEGVYVNDTGDATLAKAGSGDVLAGLIGALLAGGMPPADAAVFAVHRHGLAGESVGRRRGTQGGLAHEVADALCDVWR